MDVATEEVTTDMVFEEVVSRLRSKGTLQELDNGELVLAMLASVVALFASAFVPPPKATETGTAPDPSA